MAVPSGHNTDMGERPEALIAVKLDNPLVDRNIYDYASSQGTVQSKAIPG